MKEDSSDKLIPTVAWLSYFPIEWLQGIPPELEGLPKMHPATWQRVLLDQFERQKAVNLHIIILRKQFARNISFQRNGVTFHCLKTVGGFRAPTLYWLDTLLIAGVLRKIQPDMVHAWGTEDGAAAVVSRLPYPRLVTMQGILRWYGESFALNFHDKISAYLERSSLRKARFVTVESCFGMDYLKRNYPQLELFQAEHAPDPIFHSKPRNPSQGITRFIYVGSFDYRKGADILFSALDALRKEFPFELVFIGGRNPEFEKQIRSQTSTELWERVSFKGSLRPDEVADEICRANCLVFPSRADNSPNSVKEAVVVGLPVVASSTGGIVDYVVPGKNGYLFTPGNTGESVNALRKFFNDPMMRNGRVDSETHLKMRAYLSPERMAENFLRAYDAVLGSKK